jgi:Ca-activated chloride channel homolog
MTFGHPGVLWLLVIPVLLIAHEIAGRKHHVALPFDHGDQSTGRWLGRLTTAASLLPSLILGVAIVFLAAPLISANPQQTRQLTNIDFVLDVSGSMNESFGNGTRYDAAMSAINDFTSRRKGDAFGLTIFGNEVLEWTPLTQDTSAIRNATPFLRPETLPSQLGGTEIGKAVIFCCLTARARTWVKNAPTKSVNSWLPIKLSCMRSTLVRAPLPWTCMV